MWIVTVRSHAMDLDGGRIQSASRVEILRRPCPGDMDRDVAVVNEDRPSAISLLYNWPRTVKTPSRDV